ncbi:MAG: slr1658 superfamily regulator [Spirochaetota bacterium]
MPSNSKIIGNFDKISNQKEEFLLKLEFSVDDFKSMWKRCNLVSNYIAEYSSYNFEPEDKAENLISTVINELIEFITPISEDNTKVDISFKQYKDNILFEIGNVLKSEKIKEYENILENINKKNIEELYFNIISQLETEDNNKEFGLLMLANDYKGNISSKLYEKEKAITRVLIENEEIK